jgi:predicted small integral membrane protein
MTSWQGGASSWRAVGSAPLNWLGAIWIIAGDLAAAVLCTASVARMWSAHNATSAEFAAAKKLALAGCGILAIMLFGGFTVLAETWFELWRSDAMRSPVLDIVYRC